MKPEDRKRLKQHIEMIVDHKTPVEELEDTIRRLRVELHTLRFKESQEQRFIWWVWNVYSRNVNDLIYDIMGATTYDTEGEAKEGKYGLPKHCFDLMKRIDEYTEHIYDGTYLDIQMSINDDLSEANQLLRSAYSIAKRKGVETNWDAFERSLEKELMLQHNRADIRLKISKDVKTSTDNNKGELK